jgi:hypothetical protein
LAGFTVDLSESAHQVLRTLSEQSGEPISAVLDKAIQQYRRQRFLDESNAAFQRLRDEPASWQEVLDERRVWDGALADGLSEP